MSRIYDTALFYSVKLKARAEDHAARNALWDGSEKLTAPAAGAMDEVAAKLKSAGYKDAPKFHLVCSHSD